MQKKQFADSVSVRPDSVNAYLLSVNSAEIDARTKISSLVARPAVKLCKVLESVPRGTFKKNGVDIDVITNNILSNFKIESDYKKSLDFVDFGSSYQTDVPSSTFHVAQLLLRSNCQYPLEAIDSSVDMDMIIRDNYHNEIFQDAEISIKYSGYIEREQRLAEKISRLNELKIPDGFDFSKVESLSIECRQKLTC